MSVFIVFISLAWASNCRDRFVDWKGPQSICTEWSKKPAILADLGAKGVIPNPLKSFQLKARKLVWRSDFEQLVRAMMAQTAGGRSDGELTARERFITLRLQKISLDVLSESDAICAIGSQVNARYLERTNRLQVCALVTHLTWSAALPLIAHELGHLADACQFRQGFAFTDRVPRSIEGIRRVVNECGVRDLMSDADARADRALELTPTSSRELKKEIAKLIACGLLHPTTDPELPALELDCKGSREPAADEVGFRLISFYLREHPKLDEAAWLSYFYAAVNCSPAEHQAGVNDYAPSQTRITDFLKVPEVRSRVGCEF